MARVSACGDECSDGSAIDAPDAGGADTGETGATGDGVRVALRRRPPRCSLWRLPEAASQPPARYDEDDIDAPASSRSASRSLISDETASRVVRGEVCFVPLRRWAGSPTEICELTVGGSGSTIPVWSMER